MYEHFLQDDVEHIFTKKELSDTQQLTYLSKKQIKTLYKRFCSLVPDMDDPKNPVIPATYLYLLPELRMNPLRERIIKVFSTQYPDISFDDFLNMMSVYSSRAPLKVKASYAFRLFDFDEDEKLSAKDMRELLNRMKSTKDDAEVILDEDDTTEILRCMFSEADLDSDGFITFTEFEHLVSKSPDFLLSFQIKI